MFLFSNLLPAEPKGEHTELSHSNNNGPVAPTENPAEPQTTTDTSVVSVVETTEQDADDEAAEDTDDTRCVSHHISQHLKHSGYLLRFR